MARISNCGPREVCARYDIDNTLQVIDLLALMGDKSDNIPGCPGIGEKGASKLIREFGSVEKIIENIPNLKGATQKKIQDNSEQILFSKFLATIRTDAPIAVQPSELLRREPDMPKLLEIFHQLEFRTLITRVKKRVTESRLEEAEKSAIAPMIMTWAASLLFLSLNRPRSLLKLNRLRKLLIMRRRSPLCSSPRRVKSACLL